MQSSSPRKLKRGSALVTVLMVVAISTVLSSALIGSAFFNLQFSVKSDTVTIARNLADSAISHAAQVILAAPSTVPVGVILNTPQTPTNYGNVDTLNPATDYGYVTFTQSTTTPWSLYNLGAGTTAMSGFNGRSVPANSLHLVGIGLCGSTQVVTEAIVYLPPYPYVIGASGQVHVLGNLVVGATGTVASLSGPGLNTVLSNLNSLLPANMANNANAQPTTMFITPAAGDSAYIAGNVQSSAASVQMSAGNVDIKGQLTDNSDPVPLPSIDITQYDPSNPTHPEPFADVSGAHFGDVPLTGYGHSAGDMTISGGALNLNGGVLYVNGNLSISNGSGNALSGNGAIFCTGTVSISGNTQLTSDDSFALIADGDINLTGNAAMLATAPSFTGLVYTQGNLTADNMTILGSYVANGQSTSDSTIGQITVQDTVNLLQPSGGATVPLTPTPVTTTSGPGPTATALPDSTLFVPLHAPANISFATGYYQITCQATYPGTGGANAVTYSVTCTTVSGPVHNMTSDGGGVAGPTGLANALSAVTHNINANVAFNTLQDSALSGVYTPEVTALFAVGGPWAGSTTTTTPPTVDFPPGAGVSNPYFSFNQFIDVEDQARVLIWQTLPPGQSIAANAMALP